MAGEIVSMRRIFLLMMALVAWGAAVGRAADGGPPGPGDVSMKEAAALNGFGLELYGHLPAGGNLVCSPLSIHEAMGMVAAGAAGPTADELGRVLRTAQAGRGDGLIGRLLRSADAGDFQLHVANALWASPQFNCLDSYRKILGDRFGADFFNVEFANSLAASQTINRWVSVQTSGKIAELFSPGMLPAATRLVLTNAIYFHADWDLPFDPDKTAPRDFHVNGQAAAAPRKTMRQSGSFAFGHGENFDALEMPYHGGSMSMLILLPRAADGVSALESRLSAKLLRQIESGMQKQFVEIEIPKFSFSSQAKLPDVLEAMGARLAFQPGQADFSGMDGKRDLFLSNVVHKAYVAVDEKGTEAAAATGGIMMPTAVPLPAAVFRADHPFVFIIRDVYSGAIVFMGRVMDPQS
jgi:serpin B